jgi:hypothetical protein
MCIQVVLYKANTSDQGIIVVVLSPAQNASVSRGRTQVTHSTCHDAYIRSLDVSISQVSWESEQVHHQ